MLRFLLLLILTTVGISAFSQGDDFKQVKGLPSNELYNLHVDKKGFLWISHSFGISRFDGNSFTHFSHPDQSSLSMFELLEDEQGRIWCHDLVGKVFYIKDEKMHFFPGFDYTIEPSFPRMALRENQLFLSSKKGLFICDTRTLQSKYITSANNKEGRGSSLSVIDDKVLLYGEGVFTIYDIKNPEKGLLKVKIEGYNFLGGTVRLQPEVCNDTAYLISNPTGEVHKIIIKNGKPKIAGVLKTGGFINTISIVKGEVFVNQKIQSWNLARNKIIAGYNISDIEFDKEGNTWCSSLEKGLLVNYRFQWKNYELPGLGEDKVSRIVKNDRYCVYGTNSGKLIVEEFGAEKKVFNLELPGNFSSVDYLRFISKTEVLVGSLYYVDLSRRVIERMNLDITVKCISETENSYLVATAFGLYEIEKNKAPNFFRNYTAIQLGRFKAVAYDSLSKTIIASGKDGLYSFANNKWEEIKFNKESINASDIKVINGKKYISTYNRGLFVWGTNDTVVINEGNGLYSNTIIKTRLFQNHLWLIGSASVQVVNLPQNQISSDIKMPALPGYQINDVNEHGDTIMIATNEGLVYTHKAMEEPITPKGYIIALNVNGKDTIAFDPLLPYNSSIRFSISLPLFSDPGQLYFKYRLHGSGNDAWSMMSNGVNDISFVALSPGEYELELIAMHPRFKPEGYYISYPFTIQTPWYSTWWFRLVALALFAGVAYGLYIYRLRQLMKVEKFRQKISSDLHDDIGSTLSSINIYSSLAKQEGDNVGFLNAIQGHSQEVISKLDDLVWTINPKNDTIENLVERMRSFAVPILKAKGINCRFSFESDHSYSQTTIELRTNLYLAFKEMVNNVVKHSEATECYINISLKNKQLSIEVKDNGKGFEPALVNPHRNGLQNLLFRAKENKGWFNVESGLDKGTACTFGIKL